MGVRNWVGQRRTLKVVLAIIVAGAIVGVVALVSASKSSVPSLSVLPLAEGAHVTQDRVGGSERYATPAGNFRYLLIVGRVRESNRDLVDSEITALTAHGWDTSFVESDNGPTQLPFGNPLATLAPRLLSTPETFVDIVSKRHHAYVYLQLLEHSWLVHQDQGIKPFALQLAMTGLTAGRPVLYARIANLP